MCNIIVSFFSCGRVVCVYEGVIMKPSMWERKRFLPNRFITRHAYLSLPSPSSYGLRVSEPPMDGVPNSEDAWYCCKCSPRPVCLLAAIPQIISLWLSLVHTSVSMELAKSFFFPLSHTFISKSTTFPYRDCLSSLCCGNKQTNKITNTWTLAHVYTLYLPRSLIHMYIFRRLRMVLSYFIFKCSLISFIYTPLFFC